MMSSLLRYHVLQLYCMLSLNLIIFLRVALYQSIASKLHAAKFGAASASTVQHAHHHGSQPPSHQPNTHSPR